MKKKLLSFKTKTITIEQLMKLAGDVDYNEFATTINEYVAENLLEPVNASRTNGRRPSLYNKYRINKPKEDYSTALDEIKLLHPNFNHSKYAKQPAMYVKYKKEIELLSQFFWEQEDLLKQPMSMNERSFQIWGIEKLIKEKSVIKTIFQFNDLDMSILNVYETPEPFFEYNFANEKEMNILIIENKDTWFTLRKIMREEGINYLFRDYHVLLYGEGKMIISRNNRLNEYDQLLTGSANNYFYFGDLDYEGIDIYQTLVTKNCELSIHLCTELYVLMLKEANIYNLPKAKAGQKKIDLSLFLNEFTASDKADITTILENGYYIPQEILNYPLFKAKMMERLND
ncbi:hypothetical protein CIB95_11730 [Lottiidibacillus patelloidae]|uniref:Wadjet protein JetD C-terminal domain-containing protein n=1 Tax=Lottiidibacillus patelloidae TaxID=2670334 RepID=A0A263BS91_9BACI|nr:hypothetical protein [Lottiidibacillus patelloidae]OZM56438.1 hypothetical protein CIB95_11730 [Lottiidibacillus patelloidae]